MNDFFQKLRTFYMANRMLVLGGVTALSVVLIAWARIGFTLEFSRFYAAPAPATLTVQCTGSQANLSWNIPEGADSNSIQKNVNEQGWQFILQDTGLIQTSLTDTFTPVTVYRHKSGAASVSNLVQCPAVTPSPTPTPTATPTPTPTPTSTPTPTPTPTPTATPSPTVSPTYTPVSAGTLDLAVDGRNASTGSAPATVVSAAGNQEIRVHARVTNGGSQILTNIAVFAALPAGLVYVPGSTTINNAPTTTDTVAGTGLPVGSLGAGQAVDVTFLARVSGASFSAGQSQVLVTIQTVADSSPAKAGQVAVVVNRPTGQVGGVKTGPADAVWAALIVSAITTLLYVSYTHTPAFRRREIDTITAKPDPLDFRN